MPIDLNADVGEGLDATDEAILPLTAADYRVFMLGFSPGFGYLGPLAPPLRTPRRDEPRLRVPAGSVAIAGAGSLELASLPMLPGAIQLPPNGLPIVLMPDAPTVGVYPVPAVIAASDRHITGQLRPGDELTFEWVDEDEARRRMRERSRRLAALVPGPA